MTEPSLPAPPTLPVPSSAGTLAWAPRAIALMIVALLLASAVAVVTHDGEGEDAPAHPDAWDPRVASLAASVEESRGLKFDHPVYVDFLTPAEYTKQTTTEEKVLDKDRKSGLERQAASLRALGVASGKLDLFAAFNSVSDAGTLAFYDPNDDRVRVRGTEVTVGLQVTLVHELTHALQDQHFDLERLYDGDLDSGASTAFRALIEGDALRIEEAYVAEELHGRGAIHLRGGVRGRSSTRAPPPRPTCRRSSSASFSVPYLLGKPFVTLLVNKGGNRRVDEGFKRPPTTEEHLFDPASFLADEHGREGRPRPRRRRGGARRGPVRQPVLVPGAGGADRPDGRLRCGTRLGGRRVRHLHQRTSVPACGPSSPATRRGTSRRWTTLSWPGPSRCPAVARR